MPLTCFCLSFVAIAVRVELYLVDLIPLILFAQHNQNVRIFLEAGSSTELPRCTTTMDLARTSETTSLHYLCCSYATITLSLVNVLVCWPRCKHRVRASKCAPHEVSRPFDDVTVWILGFLCTWDSNPSTIRLRTFSAP